VTDSSHLAETRASYDTVAESYAEFVRPVFQGSQLGRAMIGAFAELVQESGGGRVADVGCGPGHVTAHLRQRGLTEAFGIDLSPGMIEVARRDHPGVHFTTGTMTSLDIPDGDLAGIVAWYSIIHIPRAELPTVFGEFHRTLAPGGHLLLGFHVGDETRRKSEGYGHAMALDVHLLPPDHVAELAAAAGFTLYAQLLGEAGTTRPHATLLLRKPR
jgi:SAM-dependent methyltransferase